MGSILPLFAALNSRAGGRKARHDDVPPRMQYYADENVAHTHPDPAREKVGGKTSWDAQYSEGLATPSFGMMVISDEVTPQKIHESYIDDETPPARSNARTGFVPQLPYSTHRPGAFAVAGSGREGDIESVIQSDDNPELLELSAEVVDTEEENRKRQEQVEKEVREKLDQKLAEREKNTAVAEIVRGMWCSQRVRRFSILGIVLVVVIVAVVLGTVLPQRSPLTGLNKLLSSVSLDGGAALQTPSTPQNNALNWLAGNANLESYSDEKKIQRYTLATLYLSTNGSFWQNKTGWLSDSDECMWHNDAFERVCSDGGTIVELHLITNNLEGALPAEIALLSNSLGKCSCV